MTSKNIFLSILIGAQIWSVFPAQAEPEAQAKSPGRSWGLLQFLGPNTLADIASSVAPSVVNIDVSVSAPKMEASAKDAQGQLTGKARAKAYDRFYKYFGVVPPAGEPNAPPRGTGSGVILKPDGIILTSNHLVQSGDRIRVTLHDGRIFYATVLGHDSFSDLAVVKIQASDLPVAKFGSSQNLRPGDWVLAIGSPLGLDHTVTLGIVSALGRQAKGLDSFGARSGAVRFIQTDAAINPGNSGGPLVNLNGEVIGINTFIRGDAQNIGFAIPADVASEVAAKLMRFQEIAHPFIGVVMDPDAKGSDSGVVIRAVSPKGPAANGGLVAGDIILELNGKPVTSSEQVSDIVRACTVGQSIPVRLKRSGEEKLLKVQVDQLPDDGGFE